MTRRMKKAGYGKIDEKGTGSRNGVVSNNVPLFVYECWYSQQLIHKQVCVYVCSASIQYHVV